MTRQLVLGNKEDMELLKKKLQKLSSSQKKKLAYLFTLESINETAERVEANMEGSFHGNPQLEKRMYDSVRNSRRATNHDLLDE